MKKLAAFLLFAFAFQTTSALAQVGGAGGASKPAAPNAGPAVKKDIPVTRGNAR